MTEFKKRDKNDIYGMPILGFLFKNSFFLMFLKVSVLILFIYGVYLGFVDTSSDNTFTRYLFWGLFWSLFMVVTLSSMGRIFCGICPHGFIGKYITKWGLKRTMPKFLENRFIGLWLIVIGWWGVYYAYPGFFKTPLATSIFFTTLTVVAIVFFFLYRDMGYCKSICPIGSLTRAYHRVSSTWLGTYGEDCSSCKTFECAKACSYDLKPFTFDKTNNMKDCTLCMDCSASCESISFKFKKPSFSLFNRFKYEKVEVWTFILITAAISITMNFHHALGRTTIVDEFIWTKTARFAEQYIHFGSMDTVGLFAFLYATFFTVAVVYIGMFIASKFLNASFEKVFYTLGYAFAPIFIIGGLSHLLHSFFTHNYANIANGFIYGFGLDVEQVSNLASRGDTWLHIFNYLPYLATIWAYLILVKRVNFFNVSKVKKVAGFIFASSLISFFLMLNFYKIYVYKTYGVAQRGHQHSKAQILFQSVPKEQEVICGMYLSKFYRINFYS